MQPQLKHLGLTQLEKALPTLHETARQEQWTYELFLNRVIAAEIEGRDRRAAERLKALNMDRKEAAILSAPEGAGTR